MNNQNSSLSGRATSAMAFAATVDSIRDNMKQSNWNATAEVGRAALRLEGFANQDTARATLSQGRSGIQSHVDALVAAMSLGASAVTLDENGRELGHQFGSKLKVRNESLTKSDAVMGFALANDIQSWGQRDLPAPNSSPNKATSVVAQSQGMAGGFTRPVFRQEAFRDIDTHASVVYSMGFGASITRQTEFVMGWYPPIMLDPNLAALEVKLNLLTVFNGAVHDTETGNMTQFSRRNVARAFENGNILNRYATLAMPIHSTDKADHFVPATTIAPSVVTYGNRSILTSWLKFENDGNILGLSTTAATLDTQGKPTHRESLEPGTKVESILIKSGADLIVLPLLNLRTMNFVGAQQWDQQETILNGNVTLGLSGSKLKTSSGAALVGPLKFLADNNLRIGVQMKVNGSINIETANYNFARPSFRLVSVEDVTTNEVYTAGSATWATIETAVKALEAEGIKVRPFKTNSTKREQGDRLNTRRFVFQYMAPYRDPVTVERMVNTKGDHDAQDLTNLMGLVKIRIENEAIDHMFEMFDLMRAYVDMNASDGTMNDLPGLAQFWTIPCFHEETLDLSTYVDSVKSHERAEDIQAFLVLKLRDISTRLLTFSQWKAGMIMQNNDTLPPPQINIATNPILARYLLAPGDMRTLGDYDYVVTTTLNRQLRDKIAISFRIPGQEASNDVQIFGWGHLLTSAEVVFASNMMRQNDYFAELQVQPRYDFLPMNLTGALLTVTGVKEVLGKIPGYSKLIGPLNVNSTVVTPVVPVGP